MPCTQAFFVALAVVLLVLVLAYATPKLSVASARAAAAMTRDGVRTCMAPLLCLAHHVVARVSYPVRCERHLPLELRKARLLDGDHDLADVPGGLQMA